METAEKVQLSTSGNVIKTQIHNVLFLFLRLLLQLLGVPTLHQDFFRCLLSMYIFLKRGVG